MSRYKKASYNEYELPELGGVKAIIRPTRDEKMQISKAFIDFTKSKGDTLESVRKAMSDLLYNSLFVWEDNKRTTRKDVGEEETTRDDIDQFVVDNFGELWMEILHALDIVDKSKLEELKEQQKKELEKPLDPN